MTPLARAIQAHENAAGRPMGDEEAQHVTDAIKSVYNTPWLTVEMSLKAFRNDIPLARAAYAAGVKAGKGEVNA